MFSKLGFDCLIPGYELADYLDPRFFPEYYSTRACLMVNDFLPRFPEPTRERPLVVHAPSNKAKKGTEAVLGAMARLSRTHQFDFRVIHRIPRQKGLELIAQSDIFLDQFTIGAEGLAAYEAMAFGKPVVCFIKPSLLPRYPAGLPIVVADQENLQKVVASLLKDGSQRNELGRAGRKYVEQHHDARNICRDLVKIYQELCARRATEKAPLSADSPYRRVANPTARS